MTISDLEDDIARCMTMVEISAFVVDQLLTSAGDKVLRENEGMVIRETALHVRDALGVLSGNFEIALANHLAAKRGAAA